MVGGQVTLLDHTGHHGEEGFVQGFAGGGQLLRNLLTILFLFNLALQTAQLSFHARQAHADSLFFSTVFEFCHVIRHFNIPPGVYCTAIILTIVLFKKGTLMNLATLLPHPFLQAGVGGILIGLASWLLLASLGRVAGISGIAAGALIPTQGALAGERAWRWAFVAGLVLVGAAAAALLNTPNVATRPLPLLAVAGLLVGFGTVVGSGCTSGHGVCGLGRRSVRSLVATLVFMGMGAATVFVATFAGTVMVGA
jgi:uncharacterized protein